MSVQGKWVRTGSYFQECTLAYAGSSNIDDALKVDLLDIPILKIELLECSFGSATAMSVIQYSMKNRNLVNTGNISNKTIGHVYRTDPFDATVYGNRYIKPLILTNAGDVSNNSCKHGSLKIELQDMNGTKLTPTFVYLRLRIHYRQLQQVEMIEAHEPQILMV